MKNLLFLLLFPIISIAQNSQETKNNSFIISGYIKGLHDSTQVIFGHPGETNSVIATGFTKGGKFKLFGKVNSFDIYQLSFIDQKEVADLFIGNENVTVAGDVANLNKLTVTGAKYHDDFNVYLTKFTSLKNSLNELVATANKTPEGAQRDAIVQKIESQKNQVNKQVDDFIKQKPTSPVATFLVYATSPVATDITVIEQRYSKLKTTAKEGFYANAIESMIAGTKVGLVGTQSVDFALNDTANIPVKLSSYKGKYVLVDFWASWCGPCRMENPSVVSAYNDFKGKNFTVLGVSLDMNKDKWMQAIKADNLAWTHVSDLKYWQNAAAQLYRIQSIPANMLIDPNGKIVARDLRGEALRAKLKQVLK